ncbi:major capsid protein [Exiguobacterium sp. USCH10]|uniref:major capsid protein n=1 Tax=Exiguobacterium sp. USCH10 TaxID=3024839 RepID=UPI00309C1ADD
MDFSNTLTLLQAVEQMPPARSFLKDTFFPGEETFLTEEVLLDIRKGNQKMAPFVAPRVGGVTMERQGFQTTKYTAPRIAPQRVTTIDDIKKRGFGESIVSARTPEDRQAELVAKDLQELDAMITRREEWMAAQVLFFGSAILKGYVDFESKNFVEQQIDYKFTNTETLTLTDRWGEGADIYSDLEEWRLEIIQKTGIAPEVVVLGRQAAIKVRNDEKMQKLLDIRNMNFGQIEPSVRGDGTTFIGRLPGLGLDLVTYDAWYLDEDNVSKPFVPEDRILMAPAALGTFAYGAITQMEQDESFMTYEGSRVPKMWADRANEVKMMRVSSRPLPKPNDVDAWFVAKVV